MIKSEDEMDRAYSRHRSEEECTQGFGEKIRKQTTTRHRRKDNIKMDFREMGVGY
jgi:hypothetical protein